MELSESYWLVQDITVVDDVKVYVVEGEFDGGVIFFESDGFLSLTQKFESSDLVPLGVALSLVPHLLHGLYLCP